MLEKVFAGSVEAKVAEPGEFANTVAPWVARNRASVVGAGLGG